MTRRTASSFLRRLRGAPQDAGRSKPRCRQGEVFKGEYVTVGDDTSTWGTVFAAGSTINGYAVSAQGKRRGTAIVTSSQGHTIECEFVSNAGHGYGSCRDNASKLYKLMF